MKHLTNREEEIMEIFWEKGSMFVKEVIELLADPSRTTILFRPLSEGWRKKVLLVTNSLEIPTATLLSFHARSSAKTLSGIW